MSYVNYTKISKDSTATHYQQIDRYQDLPEEEKIKKGQYGRERYRFFKWKKKRWLGVLKNIAKYTKIRMLHKHIKN